MAAPAIIALHREASTQGEALTHAHLSPWKASHRPFRAQAWRGALAWSAVALGCAWTAGVTAQQVLTNKPGIFVCVDAKGRRLTSDRPIPECLDREQRELSSSGATRRVVSATLTAEERARQEAQAQQEAAQRAKTTEDRRRDHALLSRYPHQRKHDDERAKQLAQVDEVIASIQSRTQELDKQRAALDTEMEFYKSNPASAPAWLVRRREDNAQQQEAQKRLVAIQVLEKQRINSRFDEELSRLLPLWTAQPSASR